MDIKTLIAVATGEIPHNYRNGLCPDELQPESRDQDCQACKILTDAEKDGRFIVEVDGSLIGGVLRQIEAHPCQGQARQQEADESDAMTYSYSYDDETFHGTFASPEEAAADYLNDRPDEESVEVGQNQRRTAHNYVGEYHIESLLEMVAESAYEECGDCAKHWLSDLTKDTKQIKELKQLVGDWIQSKEPPGFWHVDFIRRITRAELVESGHLDQPARGRD